MLWIYSNSYSLSIPEKLTEVVIYATNHFKDESGQIFDTPPAHERFYHYGNLIIETPFSRYIFKDVYSAYAFPAKINRVINKERFQYFVSIDLDALCSDNHFCAEGGFEIISKAQTINLQVEDYEELPF